MKKNTKKVGIFKNTERGYGFIDFEDEDLESVFVAPRMAKDALNGDKVEFEIIATAKRTEKKQKAKF